MHIQNPGKFMSVLRSAQKALKGQPEGTALRKSIQELQEKCPHLKAKRTGNESSICPDCLKNVKMLKFPRVRIFEFDHTKSAS
jgi:hypothetical protein